MEERGLISEKFVSDALACLQAQNIAPLAILAKAGFDAIPNQPVNAEQYGALWLAMAEAMNDEFFGLGARAMRPGSFTLLGHTVLHTHHLEHAIRRALRFLKIILDYPCGTLHRENGLATITLDDGGPPRSAFAYRAFWILLHGISCFLIGRRIPIQSVAFRCKQPDHESGYALFFGAKVNFSQRCSALHFSEHYLDLPIKRSEKALKDFLKAAPANILMRYRHDSGVEMAVRKKLSYRDCANWPDFRTLAREMRIAPSTLRRMLMNEGTNYHDIKNSLRRDLAMQLLETGLSVADISAKLGFAEPSTFYRAFAKWTGLTPAKYRMDIKQAG